MELIKSIRKNESLAKERGFKISSNRMKNKLPAISTSLAGPLNNEYGSLIGVKFEKLYYLITYNRNYQRFKFFLK